LFLGTGTSDGVPLIGCNCDVCLSTDERDKRTRSSVFISLNEKKILIDASIDLRIQFLRYGIDDIDAILLTHSHFDHISGLNDIRPINKKRNKKILCYADKFVCNDIRKRFDYFFNWVQLGGGVPEIDLIEIENDFLLFDKIKIELLNVMHGKINILGYRIGGFAYITDASLIPDETYAKLKDLDVLVINALKKEKHPTHFSLFQAINEAEKIKAKKTFITHISHKLGHREIEKLCLGKEIFPAYDGLRLNLNT